LVCVAVIAGVTLVVIDVSRMMFARRGRQCPTTKKRHRLHASAVEHWYTYGKGQDGKQITTKTWTRVLWVCPDCPYRAVTELNGNWSLEQMRRRTPAKGAESPWRAGISTR
jgi:hypothetical protein